MASGDKTKLKSINSPVVASFAPGTYMWNVTKGGRLVRYTLAGGAVQATARIRGDVKCIYCDAATYIYLGMGDGRLMRYTIADKVNSVLARFDCAITGMSVSGGLIYISLADGHLYSYEI